MEKCGALWIKKDRNGQEFYSGTINGISVMIFKNKYKETAKHPDYIVNSGQDRNAPKKEDKGEVPF